MSDRIPLVLLPGMPLDAALWEHQTGHLADVAEPTVGDLTGQDSMAALAAAVLARAPARFALAGLSMGGYVAFEILRQAPERVAKLALLDTSARPDTPEQTATRQDAVRLVGQGRLRQVVAAGMPRLVHPDRSADSALVDSVQAQAQRVGADGYIRQQTAIMNRPDSRPGLGAITCPTLVLCGRQDAITPPALHEEMAEGIPGARLALIEDCGHLSAMEQPQAVTALLRQWLLYA
ncbi:alpha/beta hydrolase (plasmid) [Azospirillum baldaniorum]|uniref:Alpha/beta hydrolase n=1 Tax=Azospirillum baldaniorum TaxID=1064539 RepID=A0A9P1JWU3_9PROT|nr:alpha/beta fold hydrolase [Azospirillum baldaniorum]TWA83884.1 pimeloyl-ACP methyl ester carboxylesterase [Azospirillum brasilense]AWJ91271.1 alpha/beta hydrolase [Azospirillum baldaniorum]NUB05726.1 alpha/beta fold hydrolase [Azospirillum baldaniorum]TWA70557.1 pimeloyl-ACP methyl ester carboxylesterase [Azospirillum baldaniorum]CCD01328.1 putative alpha/beta hydrolase [Azospirillum baldaniorum]